MALTPASGFSYYIELTGDKNVSSLFQSKVTLQLLSSLSEEQSAYRYEEGKWSIKQVLGHITDHERIMMYRALRLSRKDPTPLPGYDQDMLVTNARFDELTYTDLLIDFENVRNASLSFIRSLFDEQFSHKGIVSDSEVTVMDILKATIGHELHHAHVLKEKYI